MSFPVFTSIKPPATAKELSYLRGCLNSWRAVGFDPIAVNGPSEIKRLNGLNLPVEFAAMPADGKPCISTILDAVRASGARFAGIVNSDCKMVPFPDLASKFQGGLARTVLVAWRLDIGGGGPRACVGFDGYFFDTSVLPSDDAGYTIAGPWWDYWFPLACEVAGARIAMTPVPLLTHKVHPLNYRLQDEIAGCARLWSTLKKWYAEGRAVPGWPFEDIRHRYRTRDTLSPEQCNQLSGLVRAWIRRNAATFITFMPPEMATIESMLRLGSETLMAEAEKQILQSQLASVLNSASWRLTAPLRSMANTLRESRHRLHIVATAVTSGAR
jgi:hypothetical protein